MKKTSNFLCIVRIFLCLFELKNGHSRNAPKENNLILLDSGAKNYPRILLDQNKYATFDILANPNMKYGCHACQFMCLYQMQEIDISTQFRKVGTTPTCCDWIIPKQMKWGS